jgi:hypothetical protein
MLGVSRRGVLALLGMRTTVPRRGGAVTDRSRLTPTVVFEEVTFGYPRSPSRARASAFAVRG